MSKPTDFPNLEHLQLEDDVEDLFASPSVSGTNTEKHTPASNSSSTQKQRARSQSEARDARLKAELERVKEVNRVIEGVTASLRQAKENMGTVQRTVENASTLLATWTRILGQTEHNQRLILNPSWHGATQDVLDMENEDARRQQEADRRVLDEERRREEVQRKAEDDERRRAASAASSGRGGSKTRGVRGSSSSGRGYTGVGGQSGRGRGTTGTRGSGIGRGTSSSTTRGRGRGLG